MAINTIGGLQGAPVGATGVVFQGISTTGDYTYTTSLPIGKYILSGLVGSGGNLYWNSGSNGGINVPTASNGATYINITTADTAFNPYSSWSTVLSTTLTSGNGAANLTTTSLAWGISSSQIIAPNNSTTNLVSVSTNGLVWTTRSTGTFTTTVVHVAYNAGVTNQWVATHNGSQTTNQVSTSTDGITWTTRTTPNAASNSGVCTAINSATTNKYVMAGNGNTGNVFNTSTDGVTWTSRVNTGIGTISCIATNGTASTNQVYVAITSNANPSTTSTDGITWVSRTMALNATNIVWGNGLYVASAAGVQTSTDGITWTARNLPIAASTSGNLSFSNGIFYIAPNNNQYLQISTDGITWYARKILDTGAASMSGGTVFAINSRTFWTNGNGSSGYISSPQPAYYTLYSTIGASTLN